MKMNSFLGLTFAGESIELVHNTSEVLVEAVVASYGDLVGRTLKDIRFRSTYRAVVIAVRRQSSQIVNELGTLELNGGDTLLLLAPPSFVNDYRLDKNFSVLSECSSVTKESNFKKTNLVRVIAVLMVIASLANVPMFVCALVAIVLLILSGCMEGEDVYKALDMPILIVIASAFGISNAMQNSGAAKLIAHGLVAMSANSGVVALYAVIYVATVLFSAFVTNNAAITLMFPIA